jgi:hypothetical protein
MPDTTSVTLHNPLIKPATVDVVTAGALFGIGRSAAYERARTGAIVDGVPVLRIGSRYRVPTAALERVLGDLEPAQLTERT